MNTASWQRIEQLYHEALAQAPEQRSAWLVAQVDDASLRAEVARLLAANDHANGFLSQPALDIAPVDALKSTEPSALVDKLIHHYRIRARLGAGGMGEVYLAVDEKLGRKVALKLLPTDLAKDPELLLRFITEAKAASATAHPNIVAIYDTGEADGQHYIAQEYVEGETLRDRIKRGPLPLLEALDIAQQTAQALAAAHEAGIIHRDIKPENLMVRRDGFVKVLDFGLAGITRPNTSANLDSNVPTALAHTAPGVVLGTVHYMSPEQTRGQKLDFRTDLWSLGVVLYEMLSGQRPFAGESVPDIFVAILERQPFPLTQALTGTPPELDHIVANLLAKDREQRCSSSAKLAADLKRLHHRLELDAERQLSEASELVTLTIKPDANAANQPAVANVTPLPAPPTHTQPALDGTVTQELASVVRLSRATVILMIFFFIALFAIVAWVINRPTAPVSAPTPNTVQLPERSFHYWLTVQRMRDDKPDRAEFQSSGRDFYENGWRFKLHFSSPQEGHLYLINEGPAEGGTISYRLLFPQPSVREASAKVGSNEPLATGWYRFDQHAGVEKFWFLWAAAPIDEIEALKSSVLNAQTQGLIRQASQRDAVRALLARYNSAPLSSEDRVKKRMQVSGKGTVLLYLAELEHQ